VQAVKRLAVWEEDCAKAVSEVEKAVLDKCFPYVLVDENLMIFNGS
jgi:hypothetical protein